MFTALLLSSALAVHGIKRKSLSPSGAIAGFMVGCIIFVNPNLSFTLILLAFYLFGSRLTKVKQTEKAALEKEYKMGGQRDWMQVLCNAGLGCIASLGYMQNSSTCIADKAQLTYFCFYLGHFAACAGDTFASEIGILSTEMPYLIITGKHVPRGTNGGVSLLGTLASLAGGLVIGTCAAVTLWYQCGVSLLFCGKLLLLSTAMGAFGSLIDSLLCATLQATFYDPECHQIEHRKRKETILVSGQLNWLTNNQVNGIASLVTALVSACIGNTLF